MNLQSFLQIKKISREDGMLHFNFSTEYRYTMGSNRNHLFIKGYKGHSFLTSDLGFNNE